MLLTGPTFPDPAGNSAETDPTPRTEGKKNPANAERGEIKYQILHCCRDASSSDTVREIPRSEKFFPEAPPPMSFLSYMSARDLEQFDKPLKLRCPWILEPSLAGLADAL